MSPWQVYSRKASCIRWDKRWFLERQKGKKVKSWKVRLFKVIEALEAELQRQQQSIQLSVEAGRRQPNESGEWSIRKYLEKYLDGKVRPNYRGVGFQQEQFGYHSNGSKGWFLEQGPDVIVWYLRKFILLNWTGETRSRERRNYCSNIGTKWWRLGLGCWY